MKVRDVLTNKRKWIKEAMEHGDSRCLVGALRDSGQATARGFEAVRATIRVLFSERHGPDCEPGCIACFNDDPDTTFEDILRVCKVADV